MMPGRAPSTATAAEPRIGAFLAQGLFWNVALFGLLRLAWVDRHVIASLIGFQQAIVSWYAGTPHLGIAVTSDCSGADVMALCAAVTLAYPVAWRRRIIGLVSGVMMLLALNIWRIATLYEARTLTTLNWLHRVVWPAVLVIVTLAYVIWWIRDSAAGEPKSARGIARIGTPLVVSGLAYAAAVPWVFTSGVMRIAGEWTASGGAVLLQRFGVSVQSTADVLITARGAFQVTPECLFTPVLPLYVAGAWALPRSRSKRWFWLLAAVPLFFLLGIIRLLALAVPPFLVDQPTFLVHGFYQIVAGSVAIAMLARVSARRLDDEAWERRAAAGLGAAVIAAGVLGYPWQHGLLAVSGAVHSLFPTTLTALTRSGDQQGALAMLPAFQLAVLVGLWVALTLPLRSGRLESGWTGRLPWRSLLVTLIVLAAVEVVLLMVLGYASAHYGMQAHPVLIRGWAIAVPLAIALAWLPHHATTLGDASYQDFWWNVGDSFPVLTGARSTTYYFENEKRLIAEAMPDLAGRAILKTDLWDEAKNTRILQWVADRGARVYGIDISEPIVREAQDAFGDRILRSAISDVRQVPFADGSFDAIYSMGTVEHFAETEASVRELARVLKPGGRLILGVPNRHDPFLRPAMVWVLSRLGLYGYGFEKSFSRRALRLMLERAGLAVTLESGILFMPGWLRMLDLWCHTRVTGLSWFTGAMVAPFAWLDARVPALRRHGYLIASVGVKEIAADGVANIVPVRRTNGVEYVVDARGCDPERLRSRARLAQFFDEVIRDLDLHPVSAPVWHVFPSPGGITGVVLLAESHLTIHTYPETRLATINLYCCRGSADWDWDRHLHRLLGAGDTSVRLLRRPLRPYTS